MITSYTSKWSILLLPKVATNGLQQWPQRGIGQIPDTLMNIPRFELFDTEPYLLISARRFIQVYSCLFRIRKIMFSEIGCHKNHGLSCSKWPQESASNWINWDSWAVQTQAAKEGGQRSLVASPPPAKRTSRGCWVIVQVVLLGALAVFGFHFLGMIWNDDPSPAPDLWTFWTLPSITCQIRSLTSISAFAACE